MPDAAPDLAADPPRTLHEIESEITELAAHIHAATYRLLELIREFDEREGWGGPDLKSCAHWLNWKVGISLGAAREKVRVAHALKDLPRISSEFRRGSISFSKVRAMTRVATSNNEDTLLMIACHPGAFVAGSSRDGFRLREYSDFATERAAGVARATLRTRDRA